MADNDDLIPDFNYDETLTEDGWDKLYQSVNNSRRYRLAGMYTTGTISYNGSNLLTWTADIKILFMSIDSDNFFVNTISASTLACTDNNIIYCKLNNSDTTASLSSSTKANFKRSGLDNETGNIFIIGFTDGTKFHYISGGVTDHTELSSIGTNSHAEIDTHISNAHSKYTDGNAVSAMGSVGDGNPLNHGKYGDGDAVDAVEAVDVIASPEAADYLVFIDAGNLKKVLLSNLTHAMFTGLGGKATRASLGLDTDDSPAFAGVDFPDSYKHVTEDTARDDIANYPVKVEADFVANNYYPLIGLSTANENATKAKVGIYAKLTASGMELRFGISETTANGLTRNMTYNRQGHLTGIVNLTATGSILSATWAGDVIASSYLDSDTAHLSTTQTFSGAKTFTLNADFSAGIDVTGLITGTTKININAPSGTTGDINAGQAGLYSYRDGLSTRYIRFNSNGTFNDLLSAGAKLVINWSGQQDVSFHENEKSADVHFYGNNVKVYSGNLIMDGSGTDNERLKLPYLSAMPSSKDNGSVWMESDGLHIYSGSAESTLGGGINGTYKIHISPHEMNMMQQSTDTYGPPQWTGGTLPSNSNIYFNDGSGTANYSAKGVAIPISSLIPKPAGKTVTITNVNVRLNNAGGGSGEDAEFSFRNWDSDDTTFTVHQGDTTWGSDWETVVFASDLTIWSSGVTKRVCQIALMCGSGWTKLGGAEITYTISD